MREAKQALKMVMSVSVSIGEDQRMDGRLQKSREGDRSPPRICPHAALRVPFLVRSEWQSEED